jgi:hypothetical protein
VKGIEKVVFIREKVIGEGQDSEERSLMLPIVPRAVKTTEEEARVGIEIEEG